MKQLFTMRQAISDPNLLARAFPTKPGGPDTWLAWKTLLIASNGEKLTPTELDAYRALTQREESPTQRVEELVIVKGRRSGGTTACAAVVAYQAALVDYSDCLGLGERATALLLAPSQRQSEIAFGRVCGIFDASPLLSGMITSRTTNTLSLNNCVDIEVGTASYRSLRGLTLACAAADEAAFFLSESSGSRNTDSQIMAAIRPALITTKGLLLIASSPYSSSGELFELHEKYYGKDSPILVAKAGSRTTNPTLSQATIDRALERDEVAARSEYLSEFRADVTGFIGRDLLVAAVDQDVTERLPTGNHIAFADAASGLKETDDGDSFALSIGHATDDGTVVIDLAREWRPPFSAAEVTAEVATIIKQYSIDELTTDGFASGFVRAELARHSIDHRISPLSKSELYLASLPMLTSRKVRLVNSKVLINQFCALERRPGTNGRDRIDARGHEDVANAVAGVIALLSSGKPITPAILTFMARQVAAAAHEGPPTLAQEHGREAVMQIGQRHRPADYVMVRIPNDATTIQGISGRDYTAELLVDGERVAWMAPDDARALISQFPFSEVNHDLRAELANGHRRGTA